VEESASKSALDSITLNDEFLNMMTQFPHIPKRKRGRAVESLVKANNVKKSRKTREPRAWAFKLQGRSVVSNEEDIESGNSKHLAMPSRQEIFKNTS